MSHTPFEYSSFNKLSRFMTHSLPRAWSKTAGIPSLNRTLLFHGSCREETALLSYSTIWQDHQTYARLTVCRVCTWIYTEWRFARTPRNELYARAKMLQSEIVKHGGMGCDTVYSPEPSTICIRMGRSYCLPSAASWRGIFCTSFLRYSQYQYRSGLLHLRLIFRSVSTLTVWSPFPIDIYLIILKLAYCEAL